MSTIIFISGVLLFLLIIAILNHRDRSAENERLREKNHDFCMANSRLKSERDALKRYHDRVEADIKAAGEPTP